MKAFSLIVVLSKILQAVFCGTIGESIRQRSPRFRIITSSTGLLLYLVERVIRFADNILKPGY